MIKRLLLASLAFASAAAVSSCADQRSHTQAVYMLVDTSGTYAQEVGKAQVIINYLLGTLQPGDSLAVARVKSRSFSEKDIIAKVTFDNQPSRANIQKRAFKDKIDKFVKTVGGSAYTDITGGLIQGSMFLNETGAGTKTILIFSDMQEELDKATIRDFPIKLKDIRVVALNVVKLKTDNIDPRRYMGRLEAWQKRIEGAGASEWRVINDIERLDAVLGRG
ncbi:MAG TPA: VWA domain-containing protein [Burkholderiales bacterium]|nr:VWA domain-containing protein [Burkholderiales bacterium]